MTSYPMPIECPHAEDCGACGLLGREYDDQLAAKSRVLADTLRRQKGLGRIALLPCLPSPRLSGYRNRAKMAVGISKFHAPKIGYFRAGSREITDAPQCRVLLPEILETSRSLRDLLLQGMGVPRQLRHVDIRCGSDPRRQHLILVIRSEEMPRLPIDRIRRACRHVDGISVNLNPRGGAQVIKGAIQHQWGAREVFVKTADISLRVSPGSFFQVNLSLLPDIHRLMGTFLQGGKVLLDLYAGVGTHGLALHRQFENVVCVEGVRIAVADTKASLKANRIGNVKVIAKPVERSLEPLVASGADCVVMNPSRAGARAEVCEALNRSAAKRLAYLSCDATTLSRDLQLLVQGGFRIQTVQAIDMMPQTKQVEALALLRRD